MKLTVRDIICRINNELMGVFTTSKFYGLAELTERDGLTYPIYDGKMVGYDDGFKVSGYHRMTGYSVLRKAGYGENNTTTNTFNMMLVVNSFLKDLKIDEVAMIIQAILEKIKSKDVRVIPVSGVLTTKDVFLAEYRGHEYVVKDNQSLMRLNYNIEVTYKSGCFDLCPEDFVNNLN